MEEWRSRLHTARDPFRASTLTQMRIDLAEAVSAVEEVNRRVDPFAHTHVAWIFLHSPAEACSARGGLAVSLIPLTDTVAAARTNCSAQSAAIDNLAAHQQTALQLRHWATRPFVAAYFRGVLTARYIKLCGLWLLFTVLWCVRCAVVLGAAVVGVCFVAAGIGALSGSSSSSSGTTPVVVGVSDPPRVDSSGTETPTLDPPPAQVPYPLPVNPNYSEPSPPTQSYGYGGPPRAPSNPPKSKLWTEDRKQLAKETASGLFEGTVRLLAHKYGSGDAPMKPAGPGGERMQRYNSATGRYEK